MTLTDRRILIIEDEFMLAQDIQWELEDAGAVVIGPKASVASALELLDHETDIDAVVLDVNLRGEEVFPVADALCARSIPFIFASGYADEVITARYPDAINCPKPFTSGSLLRSLEAALH